MRLRATWVAVALLLSGCGGGESSSAPGVRVLLGEGASALEIRVEIAATPSQRARGLMGRRSLGADAGMLFLFPASTRTGFHMKNTMIPLDIAFIAGTTIVEVRGMVPCQVANCPVTFPSVSYERALEVNAGTLARSGASPGTRVRVEGALPTPA